MKKFIKNIKISNTAKAFLYLGGAQIIFIISLFINHLSLPSHNSDVDYGEYTIIEAPKASVNQENKKESITEPVKYVQTDTEKAIVPIVKTVKVSKVVPIKKFVVKKRKIEIIEMTSIPALTVSNTELNHDNDLALDTFIKQNEIITEAIEVIDSVEVTENDTTVTDSIYYVLDIRTIAKNEDSENIETITTNPNSKIIPIKWNDKKIWTKADTNDKLTTNAKGNWTLYKNENTETATTQTGSSKETTYGGYKILLPSAPNEGVTDNLDYNGYETVNQTQQMKETIYWPPPIFDKWHWQENSNLLLFYQHQQLLE